MTAPSPLEDLVDEFVLSFSMDTDARRWHDECCLPYPLPVRQLKWDQLLVELSSGEHSLGRHLRKVLERSPEECLRHLHSGNVVVRHAAHFILSREGTSA